MQSLNCSSSDLEWHIASRGSVSTMAMMQVWKLYELNKEDERMGAVNNLQVGPTRRIDLRLVQLDGRTY